MCIRDSFKGTDIVVLEDNPYRELRFSGTATDSFGKELGEQCCMLGTFSKIVAPGMRCLLYTSRCV